MAVGVIRPVVAALALVAVMSGIGLAQRGEAQEPVLSNRIVLPMVAKDGIGGGVTLPDPDPSYCAGSGGPTAGPPNSVLGTLSIGGAPAPVGTIVQITFDGVKGPARDVREAGGYRVDYAAGGASCPNRAGAVIGILVNGQAFLTGVAVGSEAANPFLRFDIAAP